jgi:hypothetical protein
MRRPRLAGLVVIIAVMGLAGAPAAHANHSIPQPYVWFWDLGNNFTPDASVSVDAQGSGWTTLALDRLKGATVSGPARRRSSRPT